jgi:streptogramin lyase
MVQYPNRIKSTAIEKISPPVAFRRDSRRRRHDSCSGMWITSRRQKIVTPMTSTPLRLAVVHLPWLTARGKVLTVDRRLPAVRRVAHPSTASM